MKTVFTSKELPHIWAHKLAPHGRSAGNVSFNGDAILSYGTEIARHVPRKGKPAVIFNSTGYSITTSGAQSRIRAAIPGDVPVFTVDGIPRGRSLQDVTGAMLFNYAAKQAASYALKATRCRAHSKDWNLGQQSGWLNKAKAVSEFFGLRRKVDEQTIARLAEAEKRASAKAAKQEREREAELLRREAEDIAAWLSGAPDVYSRHHWPAMLRLEGGEVVTSKGARVPAADAQRTFRFAVALRDRGWHRNGETHQVGGYQLDAVNKDGIVAGCHRIAWPEIERFAKLQGWVA